MIDLLSNVLGSLLAEVLLSLCGGPAALPPAPPATTYTLDRCPAPLTPEGCAAYLGKED